MDEKHEKTNPGLPIQPHEELDPHSYEDPMEKEKKDRKGWLQLQKTETEEPKVLVLPEDIEIHSILRQILEENRRELDEMKQHKSNPYRAPEMIQSLEAELQYRIQILENLLSSGAVNTFALSRKINQKNGTFHSGAFNGACITIEQAIGEAQVYTVDKKSKKKPVAQTEEEARRRIDLADQPQAEEQEKQIIQIKIALPKEDGWFKKLLKKDRRFREEVKSILERKLREYDNRRLLREKRYDPNYFNAYYKFLITKKVLDGETIDTTELAKELRRDTGDLDISQFNSAAQVIHDYCTTGGENLESK